MSVRRHRVTGIDRQVEQDLLEAAGIGVDGVVERTGTPDDLDVLAEDAGEKRELIFDAAVEGKNPGMENLSIQLIANCDTLVRIDPSPTPKGRPYCSAAL